MVTIDSIKKELDKLGKKGDKKRIVYVKSAIKEEETKEKKDKKILFDLKKVLFEELKENPVDKYYIGYDSLGEGVEPLYFWMLDFMRDKEPGGLGLDVVKTAEGFEASAASGYFGEMGARAGVMQDRAMKILQTINTVIKSILNLIYDLKEFDGRLKIYDHLHSKREEEVKSAKLALKGIWMDQVDIKKGRGSINMLAQQLSFVTLRDAFMIASNLKQINDIDLNDRVKNILLRKIEEYLEWEAGSEVELRKRYQIEKAYLKSQVDSLKLYTKWIAPYLKAAQKLGMKEFNTPDIVAAFNNMQMELRLFGRKEVKPESVHESFVNVKLNKKYYSCLEISFNFRTVPQTLRTERGSHYIHAGRTEINFKAYALDSDELKLFEEQELFEDMELVENLTNISLKELQDDLDKYTKEPEKEEKKEEKHAGLLTIPVQDVAKGFKEIFEPLKIVGETFRSAIPINIKGNEFVEKEIKKAAEDSAKSLCYVAYDVYKKSHGMLTW